MTRTAATARDEKTESETPAVSFVSLGRRCYTKGAIVDNGLPPRERCPFDWLQSSPKDVLYFLRRGFEDTFVPDRIEFRRNCPEIGKAELKHVDCELFVMWHDVDAFTDAKGDPCRPPDAEIDRFCESYRRRGRRLFDIIDHPSDDAFFIMNYTSDSDRETVEEVFAFLRERIAAPRRMWLVCLVHEDDREDKETITAERLEADREAGRVTYVRQGVDDWEKEPETAHVEREKDYLNAVCLAAKTGIVGGGRK